MKPIKCQAKENYEAYKAKEEGKKESDKKKTKTAASLLNLNMSLAPRVRKGYGRVKLPPPYSVPLPSVRDPTSVTRDNFVSDHK